MICHILLLDHYTLMPHKDVNQTLYKLKIIGNRVNSKIIKFFLSKSTQIEEIAIYSQYHGDIHSYRFTMYNSLAWYVIQPICKSKHTDKTYLHCNICVKLTDLEGKCCEEIGETPSKIA